MKTYSKRAIKMARVSLNMQKMRGEIVEKFINIELLIYLVISRNYLKRDDPKFIFEVLYDEYFSTGLAIGILKKITDNLGLIEDLRRLSNIRNHFAHLTPFFGELFKPDTLVAPDPRNPKKVIDFKALHKEFGEKAPEAEKQLLKLYKSLGGADLLTSPKQRKGK